MPDLEILYRDENCVAINKPAGLLVHRSAIDYHEPHNAQEQLQNQLGENVFPLHRLDKPTSGVLLFALNKHSATTLGAQFREHLTTKHYLAVVRGHTDKSGTIDNPVRDKDAPDKPRKAAITHYKTLAHLELNQAIDKYASARYSLLEVTPVHGRRHQIRQHLKHISHPIIGDTSYGKSVHNRFFIEFFNSKRLLLHAQSLSFSTMPTSNNTAEKTVCVIADSYDEQLQRVIAHCDWQWLEKNSLYQIQQSR